MHPDAKHQEHHTQFSQLVGQVNITDHAGRIWTNQDTGHQITDQGR